MAERKLVRQDSMPPPPPPELSWKEIMVLLARLTHKVESQGKVISKLKGDVKFLRSRLQRVEFNQISKSEEEEKAGGRQWKVTLEPSKGGEATTVTGVERTRIEVEDEVDTDEDLDHDEWGDVEKGLLSVSSYLQTGGQANMPINKAGQTPLHRRSFCSQDISMLIDAGAWVNVLDRDGDTPLHEAVHRGHVDAVATLCAGGAKVDLKNNWGRTPMHVAAAAGVVPAIVKLFSFGASIHCKDKNGDTPLHLAAQNGRTHAAQFFVEHGADLTAKNNKGWTAFGAANTPAMRNAMQQAQKWIPLGRSEVHFALPVIKSFVGE